MLEIAGVTFRSRLMVGTGKYRTNQEMIDAITLRTISSICF